MFHYRYTVNKTRNILFGIFEHTKFKSPLHYTIVHVDNNSSRLFTSETLSPLKSQKLKKQLPPMEEEELLKRNQNKWDLSSRLHDYLQKVRQIHGFMYNFRAITRRNEERGTRPAIRRRKRVRFFLRQRIRHFIDQIRDFLSRVLMRRNPEGRARGERKPIWSRVMNNDSTNKFV